MAKLRKKQVIQESTGEPEWRKVCRYCHNFVENGCSIIGDFSSDPVVEEVFSVSEKGKLSEVIGGCLDESLEKVFSMPDHYHPYICAGSFRPLLEFISKSKKGLFIDAFNECFDTYKQDVTEHLDSCISYLYQSHVEEKRSHSVTEINPEKHSCMYWC